MKLNLIKDHENGNEIGSSLCYNSANSSLFVALDNKTIVTYDLSDGFKKSGTVSIQNHILSLEYLSTTKGENTEHLVASCSDGSLQFLRKSNTLNEIIVEKKIKAHDGAAICLRMNADGLSLATSGEDGQVKLWSKSGNLRTNLASFPQPIHCLAWGGEDNESLVIAHGYFLSILHAQNRNKAIKWVGQPSKNGIILAVDWNKLNQLIVSAGEDCCYRIFSSIGAPLFESYPYHQVITSLAWRPQGDVFVIGAFHSILLCDQKGWEHHRESTNHGTILDLKWDRYGSKVMGTCSNESVLIANLVDFTIKYGSTSATIEDPFRVSVAQFTESKKVAEEAEFQSQIIDFGLCPNHMIVCTSKECHIFELSNLENSITFDSKFLIQKLIASVEAFALVSQKNEVTIYNFEGKKVSSPRFQGLQHDFITESTMALSKDTIAFIDHSDKRVIRLYESSTGKRIGESNNSEINHVINIRKIALSQCGTSQSERRIVFIDENSDLFIHPILLTSFSVSSGKNTQSPQKMSNNINDVAWSNASNILTAIQESSLITWYYPNAPYIDKDLLQLACELKEMSFDKSATISCFCGNTVTVNSEDGSDVDMYISPYSTVVYNLAVSLNWKEAQRVCRFAKDNKVWTMLAGLAIECNELETAETALRAIKKVDKLRFIQHIMQIKKEERRNAEMFLYRKCPDEAISILLNAKPPLIYSAIKVYIRLFKWKQALDLALKKNAYIEIVLWYRHEYLIDFQKVEKDDLFLALNKKYGTLSENEIKKKKEVAVAYESS